MMHHIIEVFRGFTECTLSNPRISPLWAKISSSYHRHTVSIVIFKIKLHLPTIHLLFVGYPSLPARARRSFVV